MFLLLIEAGISSCVSHTFLHSSSWSGISINSNPPSLWVITVDVESGALLSMLVEVSCCPMGGFGCWEEDAMDDEEDEQ